ncbi:MAG: MFS transporter [Trebonia sp.]
MSPLPCILGVVLVADLLDSTITNIAAPTIVANLGGGPTLVKWLGAAYALAMGTLLVVGGRLGDKYGQRCGVSPDEAGSASGSLSAVQQIAAGVGSAAVTSVYFATLHSGQVHAVSVSLAVVIAVAALCLGAYRLLPRAAAPQEH